jgi:hypothetical protein
MLYPAPGTCPVCGNELNVTEISCPQCKTVIHGRFESCRFCSLTDEQRKFVEIFLRSRGNIKEMERELGISYPTVRSRLDSILNALGLKPAEEEEADETAERRREILADLSAGKINAADAAKLLRSLS